MLILFVNGKYYRQKGNLTLLNYRDADKNELWSRHNLYHKARENFDRNVSNKQQCAMKVPRKSDKM
jgi:hypothetical protein